MTRKAVRFLLFIIVFVAIIILFFATGVRTKAMNIDNRISWAKMELKAAEQELIKKDKVLFEIYKNNPFSKHGHLAEMELRKNYSKEYSRYLEAKIYLDDLNYTKFLSIANKDYQKEGKQ